MRAGSTRRAEAGTPGPFCIPTVTAMAEIIEGTMITIMLSLFLSAASCKSNEGGANLTPAPTDTIPAIPGWTLVWHDEFNGSSVDTSKWSYEVNGDGGGNNELQYYTARPQNSYVKDGMLVIQALQEDYMGKSYTSARMRTLKKGDWKYGRFDVRAQLPYGQGLWPAIWMLPTDWIYGGWPASGEIDIMEELGQQANKVYGTIHFAVNGSHQQSGGSYVMPQGTFASGFHLFTLEWDSTGMRWFVDGARYFTATAGKPFDQRFHLLLNVAVGGNWPGNPDVSTLFPQMMKIDYVRVYAKSG
jgi:beta-glucanase (GH16 family)